MYIFNKITVTPQLPKRIEKLTDISKNLWWSWNIDYLKLFKKIDRDLWIEVNKNPVKFLKLVSQEKLEAASKDEEFLRQYDKVERNFSDYIASKNTWYEKNYPDNKNDVIAYFSAEYGLDHILSIYSGGLGMLSGDHLKAASDLGIPLVAIGMLYKRGFFHQVINGYGDQVEEYKENDFSALPINEEKDENGNDLIISVNLKGKEVFLKVWRLDVGRVHLYMMDSEIDQNDEETRHLTDNLYGGDQETRIQQEIVLGIGGTRLLEKLGYNPTVYHMNEGHSSFLILELMRRIIEEKKVNIDIAKEIVASRTIFTTHTPVPAGNDIFPLSLVETYFKDYWNNLGISKDDFFRLGMKPNADIATAGFNMGILALKHSGKKNGVSKLHGEVSRELFGEVWPNIASNESPIGYVTNGVHTCTWLSKDMKRLYNEYLKPYWQDDIQNDETWKEVESIPDEELWATHRQRKLKLIAVAKDNIKNRLTREGYHYDEVNQIVQSLDPDVLTIGFARRFATYKRATLLFRDLERITEILNNADRPVQIIYAGKAHPSDNEGKALIKYIHELSMKPQFKGKLFLLEDYNMYLSKYLISGVDVWLNTPRRPMEASGTSGQKAAANGVINFSVLDGWWAEGYNQKNGWTIGTNKEYSSYEEQDNADCQSIYDTLEKEIIPTYYDVDNKGISKRWINIMKNSICTNAGKYSTSRMLIDYTKDFYMPLCNLYNTYYKDLGTVTEFNNWKHNLETNFDSIEITQEKDNADNITIDAGNNIEVRCKVKLPNIDKDSIEAQVYYGQISDNGVVNGIEVTPMTLEKSDDSTNTHEYKATIKLVTGGNYGYTFRVMPKSPMILDSENLNLVKWIIK